MNYKEQLRRFWKNEKNRMILKDAFLFGVSTLVFHFLYWHTNMNQWLFGPFTTEVFDFFTDITYKCSRFLMLHFSDSQFDSLDTSFLFYRLNDLGVKEYYARMDVIHDCSGIKQLMQFLLVMLLCPNKLYKRLLYFVCGSIVLIMANIYRIYYLTDLFSREPENFQYVHDWVTRPLMYVVLFALWVIWIEFFARPKAVRTPDKR